jgi:N-acetylglucosaminyl-diphospho-decaprenol L-rhamnosyltransferase
LSDSKMCVKLSIIILTWNSLDLLKRCLQSIKNTTRLNDYETIIIDNGSTDGTREFLESGRGNSLYRFILNDKNRGVGPARNQGIEFAEGEYILILDVDTIAVSDAINGLVAYLEQHPECGLVAPRLTDVNGNLQFTCRKFPIIWSKFLRRTPLEWTQNLLNKEEFRDWDHASVKTVDYVIGACQMIRRLVFEKVGKYDEKIFYGPEDIDICLRIWQAGWKVVYNPESVIIHDERRITKKRLFSKITWEHTKGLIYFFWKHKYLFSRETLYKSIPINMG